MTASAGSFSSVVRTPASLARRPLQASLGSAELAAHSAPSGVLVGDADAVVLAGREVQPCPIRLPVSLASRTVIQP
jgi:hypothetical protein